MKKYLLLVFLLPVICAAQNNAKPFIHYSIYATLNSDEKTVTAFEKIAYKNTSDTAQPFLWIRLYPNAYANDKTAYSDYLLNHDDTRFYFAKEGQRGYISQLDFKENDIILKTDFDSTKNDAIKVFLSKPLQSLDSTEITTPFFVKLPYNFDRGMEYGYNGDDTIYLSHWYPEIAYQNKSGWDLKPFTSYSTLKSDRVNFDVKIATSEKNYYGALNATLIKKGSEGDKTILEYKLNNSTDFMFALPSSAYNIVELEIVPTQGFTKLVPKLFQNKRPNDVSLTQYLINQKVHGVDSPLHKSLKPAFLFNLKETDKYNYLSFLPSVGYNNYDKAMLGIMVHNYQLPLNKFNFLLAPMYATNSKSLAGVGRLEYNIWQPKGWWRFAVSGTQYSTGELDPSETVTTQDQKPLYYQMRRIVPSISYTKYYGEEAPHKKWNFLLRTFFLKEENYATEPLTDSTYFFYKKPMNSTIVELQTTFSNNRALYPYNANLKVDADKDFLRIGFTGNGFLNYDASGKGLNVRAFAGKFFYMNSNARYNGIYYAKYNLSLSGVRGNTNAYQPADFTYSDYFIGRSETTGWMSQQIGQSDGFFKIATPANNYSQIGVSDNWIAALNFTADIPDNINPFSKLPFRMPIRAFFDVGTYSEAWTDNINAPSGKYLYDAGLQVSLMHEALTVYFPLLYSKVFRDAYDIYTTKKFVHTISFSINLENLKPKTLNKILPL